jgi:hypothetical protein
MVDIDGGYYVPAEFAREIYAALDGWNDHTFLHAQFPTLAAYASVNDLITVNRVRLVAKWLAAN